jgi:hypothetical protein
MSQAAGGSHRPEGQHWCNKSLSARQARPTMQGAAAGAQQGRLGAVVPVPLTH